MSNARDRNPHLALKDRSRAETRREPLVPPDIRQGKQRR